MLNYLILVEIMCYRNFNNYCVTIKKMKALIKYTNKWLYLYILNIYF